MTLEWKYSEISSSYLRLFRIFHTKNKVWVRRSDSELRALPALTEASSLISSTHKTAKNSPPSPALIDPMSSSEKNKERN